MKKLLVAALVTGAAVTAGYVLSKIRKGDDADCDYDDDIYDDYDNYDIDANDDDAVEAEEASEPAEENIRTLDENETPPMPIKNEEE